MKTRNFILAVFISIPILFSGCIPKQPLPVQEPQNHIVFRSHSHIVCSLTHDTSPKILAREILNNPDDAWSIEDANKTAAFRSGETIVIPLERKNRAGLYPNGYQTIPILCYHRFSETCSSELCMPKDLFASQMKYLKENGYRVITMKQLTDYLQYKKAVPEKAVVITIDDGYRSVYDIAFPILRQYGFTACLFLYTDFIGGGSALTWNQIRELVAAGFEVGSHTVFHTDLSVQQPGEDQTAYMKRIRQELVQSKEIIDKKLNQDTRFLAFPFGASNGKVIHILKQAGYTAGLSVIRGGNPFFTSPFALQRDQILSRKPEVFEDRLETFRPLSLKGESDD